VLLPLSLLLSPMYDCQDEDKQTAIIPVALYDNKVLSSYEVRT
jgi:hypothetical protein